MRKLLLLVMACALVSLAGLAGPAPAIAACTATKNCSDGGTRSCSGTTSCLVGTNYAECDGKRYYCTCYTRVVCPPPYQPWILACSNSFGSCSTTSTSVTCGSTRYTCQQCQSGQINCARLQDP